jgi:hypothetical protein
MFIFFSPLNAVLGDGSPAIEQRIFCATATLALALAERGAIAWS